MTKAREIITGLLRREFGPHADRVAIEDFFRNVEASGIRILGPDEVDPVTVVRPLDDWHEDYGDVVWWARLEGEWLGEAAWIGTPNDSDWPGYHTHWSPHPPFPRSTGRKA